MSYTYQTFSVGQVLTAAQQQSLMDSVRDHLHGISGVAIGTQPTRTVLTSGTSATYTTPTGATRINIRMVGAGGGGGASATNNGATGGDTSFGTLIAKGGIGGSNGGAAGGVGGPGGSAGTGGDWRTTGNWGGVGASNVGQPSGGDGGGGPWGGRGDGGLSNSAGAAATGFGAGGGAAGGNVATLNAGGGGGAGEYLEKLIVTPAANYTYTVGAKGAGGAAGTYAGGDGFDGVIIVDEYYN